jgi:hypothetical protein
MDIATQAYSLSNRNVMSVIVFCIILPLTLVVMLRFSVASKGLIIILRAVISIILMSTLFFICLYLFFNELVTTSTGWEGIALVGIMMMGLFIIIVMIALPIIFVQTLQLALSIVEFVVRQIAQYPKGVVPALSGLASIFAGLFKALSSYS